MARIASISSLAQQSHSSGVELIAQIEHPSPYSISPPRLAHSGSIDIKSQAWSDGFLAGVEAIAPAVSVYLIRNCLVTPNAAIMTFAGAVIQDSLFPYTRIHDIENAFCPFLLHEPLGPADDVSMTIHNTTYVEQPLFFGREHGEAGYFHWLHSILPRVDIYSKLKLPLHLLLVAIGSVFQEESLALLGRSKEHLLPSDGNTLICRELYFCTPMVVPDLDRSGGFFERALYATNLLRRIGQLSIHTRANRRLFISRSDASIRRLMNEFAIAEELAKQGFETVILTRMEFRQQVELFSSADKVISMHGAGLSNIAFMPEGGTVIELLAPDRLWPTYRGVAARSKLNYFPYVGERSGMSLTTDSDILVDERHFIEFVKKVIQ